jgi:hypothetical protein
MISNKVGTLLEGLISGVEEEEGNCLAIYFSMACLWSKFILTFRCAFIRSGFSRKAFPNL